jgi:hypothetical protein
MNLNKLIEQFLAEQPRDEDVAAYFATAAKIGFNEALTEIEDITDKIGEPYLYAPDIKLEISLHRKDV